MSDEKTRLRDKKQDELTVGDNLKIATGFMVVATLIPVAVMGVTVGAAAVYEKIVERRKNKKLKTSKEK